MELQKLVDDANRHLAETGAADGFHTCGVRSMGIMRTSRTKRSTCSLVEPPIGLVLQGSKSAQYGTASVVYRAGDMIVIGHALPMLSGQIEAAPGDPYVALYVSVDMHILRSVYSDMGGTPDDAAGRALMTGAASGEVIDSFARLFRLRRDPVEETTLGAAALREVYFRVLRSDGGEALRRVIHADGKANQVAKAISYIRQEYRNTIRASDLAEISGMSASVFYDTFKRITANSPLQFQKDLRLTEAHNLLRQTTRPISDIAYSVGYQSAAQFSREFAKKFGTPPRAVSADPSG